MSAQLSYTKTMRQAIAGMLAHDFGPADTESYIVSGLEDGAPSPDVQIPFGVFVRSLGVSLASNPSGADYQRSLITNQGMTAGGGACVGVTLRQLMQDNAIHQIPGDARSVAGEVIGVVSNGHIFVDLAFDSGVAAVADTPVFIDAVGNVFGSALGNGDSQTVMVPGAVFKTGALPSGDVNSQNVVLVKVNIIQPLDLGVPA